MIPDPSSTFQDLILDVMVEVGEAVYPDQADNRPTLPTDAATLAQFKADINDAAEDLARRHAWDWLEPDLLMTLSADGTGALSIDGSLYRYALPAWVASRPKGVVSYTLASSSIGGTISIRDAQTLERYIAERPEDTGEPVFMAFSFVVTEGTTLGQRPSSMMVVWPKPNEDYVVRMQVKARLPRLENVSQRPFWPQHFDRAVVMGAVLNRMRRGQNLEGPSLEAATARYEQIVADLKAQQEERQPVNIGRIHGSGGRSVNPPRPTTVRTYTGATL
jgi:hypothetical protein